MTDATGRTKIVGEAGNYNISAYAEGYLPKEENKRITARLDDETTIRLTPGDVVTGEVTTRRLNLKEIEELGIDTSNPQNRNIYDFTVTVSTGGQSSETTYTVTGGGTVLSSSGGNNSQNTSVVFIPVPGYPDIPPTAALFTVSGNSISYIKEMFEVKLTIINNADEQFILTDSMASLNIPSGLSLAILNGELQSKDISLDSIPGNSKKAAVWILRGDKEGEYTLTADFNGNLIPFDAPVKAQFKTSKTLIVKGSEGLKLYVYPDGHALAAGLFMADFVLRNESDIPFYGVNMTLGDGFNVTKDVLLPGDSIEGVLSFPDTSFPDDAEIWFNDLFVTRNSGSNTDIEVIYEKPKGYSVSLSEPDAQLSTGYGVDYGTGSGVTGETIETITGASSLTFDISYNSMYAVNPGLDTETPSGNLGSGGWAASYEISVADKNQYEINLYPRPGIAVKFINENAPNAYVIDPSKKTANTGNYICKTMPYISYKLEKTAGGYILKDKDRNTYKFNQTGLLISKTDKYGNAVLIEPTANGYNIMEASTGKEINIITDSNGLIQTVKGSDGTGTKFEYTSDTGGNKRLSKVTMSEGKTITYSYLNGFLETTNMGGSDVFTNTYDEKGRVLSTIDGNNKATYYSYDDDSRLMDI
jgi:YD repeat-containing protein